MSASKTIVILGARGALGQSIHARFAQEKWKQVLVGVSPDTVIRDVNSVYVNIGGVTSSQKQFDLISSKVSRFLGPDVSRIDAIVNVSGGFCMDSADVR
jgi:NAD(P)-dependent dehydrogenase (short-subunit alcohol dehydrogenase family)